MKHFDLLSAVQPSTGWIAVFSMKDGRVRQTLVDTREQADVLFEKLTAQERDVYFGVARFATDEGRTKSNVLALRSLWLDLDCGDNKPYATKRAGMAALKTFCADTKLPRPIVVDSGRGLHIDWPFEEAVTRSQWEVAASALHRLCTQYDLHVDPSVFEVARVLRVPGTYNFKGEEPLPVCVLLVGSPHPFADLCTMLGVEAGADVADVHADDTERTPQLQLGSRKRPLTALGEMMADNRISSFAKIMRRSAKGDGCPQLLSCYTDRAQLPEPRWFNALSIAKFCEDRDQAIHRMSQGYPDYDPRRVEAKIAHIKGPNGCATFEKNNPGGCDGCPHWGKIKTPIVLGHDVREAEAPAADDGASEDDSAEPLPDIPEPFFRGASGGIWRRSGDEEGEPIFVYEHDIYVVKRMRDPTLGDVIVMRVHMPRDGTKEFVVSNIKVAEPSELRKCLAAEGVVCGKKRFDLLTEFLLTSIRELQFKKKAELMRLQFGWVDGDSKFIVGDREISATSTTYSPPAAVTAAIAARFTRRGTLEKWKEVFALYGRPGLEMHAFAALTAFGAPLFKFLGQKGAIINVIHPSSGTGKTTILHMCNSVWGNPSELCAKQSDTFNTKIQKLGVYCNLPYTIDEMTNTSAQDFSTLAYNMTQGSGKDRMKASVNELRANLTSWQTVSLCSSNSSFYEKMAAFKHSPDGEIMRLFEYKIGYSNAIPADLGKEMFDHVLMDNYGHAGDIFIHWVLCNLEKVMDTLRDVQARIDKGQGLTQRERFWSATIASNIVGGMIAKKLGLLDWDMNAIFAAVTRQLLLNRKDLKPQSDDPLNAVAQYLSTHINNALIVNDAVDLRSNKPAMPLIEPKGELLIRYEPDTRHMYLSVGPFRRYCAANQIDYRETIRTLEKHKVLIGNGVKRIAKGMKLAMPAVHCIQLDCGVTGFIRMDEIVAEIADETPGEGRAV
jgi:hypothetical protein